MASLWRIVGSRQPSLDGCYLAEYFLARAGFVIDGLASGKTLQRTGER